MHEDVMIINQANNLIHDFILKNRLKNKENNVVKMRKKCKLNIFYDIIKPYFSIFMKI